MFDIDALLKFQDGLLREFLKMRSIVSQPFARIAIEVVLDEYPFH